MKNMLLEKRRSRIPTNCIAIGLLTISSILLVSNKAEATYIAYDVQYNPVSGTSVFTNHFDSLAPLRTFSSIINPSTLGGAFNPLWVTPGDSISFFSDGTYATTSRNPFNPVQYINGTVDRDKIFRLSLDFNGEWHKRNPGPPPSWTDHNCEQSPPSGPPNQPGYPRDCSDNGKRSDWYAFPSGNQGSFTDGNQNYQIDIPQRGLIDLLVHVGADEPGESIPPRPGTSSSSLLSPINFFEPDAPAFLLAGGLLTVPHTDTLDFMSVYTPNAGAGSVPEPSSIFLLIIGSLSFIGFVRANSRRVR